MSVQITFEWDFSPPDYFEEPINISRLNYNMSIANGKVVAELNSAIFDANPLVRKELHDALIARFLGVQLLTHRAYKLANSPTMAHVHLDGRRDIFIELESQCITSFMGSFDMQVTNKIGIITKDSKKDRIEKKNAFAELVTKYSTDNLLNSLLKSYGAAVNDPNNELVHLYEIREALSKKLGKANVVKTKLSITSSHWSRFGLLCDNLPLNQGRHRGKFAGALRDANDSELNEARGTARAMIEGYLQHLEITSK